MNYCFYGASGAILFILRTPAREVVDLQGSPYLECGEEVDDISYYVSLSGSEPTIKKRVPLDTTHIIDGLSVTFADLPAGLTLEIDGSTLLTDGDDVIEFDLPGTYTIELSGLVEYLDEALEVTIG